MKKLIKYLIVFVAVAALAHVATVWFMPEVLMALAGNRILDNGQVGYNQFYHSPPHTADNDLVVMTCPDLLYSFCVYNLEGKALRLTMPPVDSYWSAALYSGDTTNYLTISDRDMNGRPLDLVLAGPGWRGAAPAGATLVRAPSAKGLIMLRTLIVDNTRIDHFIGIQKQIRLEPLESQQAANE